MVSAMIKHWISKLNQQNLTKCGVAQYAQHIFVQLIKLRTGQLSDSFMLHRIDTQRREQKVKGDNLAIHSSPLCATLLINKDHRSDWTKIESPRFNSLKVDEHTCHKICNILVFIKQRENAQMKRFGK